MKTRWKASPYIYIFPALILLLAFRLLPIIMSFIISFFEWTLHGTGAFLGLNNYSKLVNDPEFWHSMMNTVWVVVFVVPASLMFSLVFAVLLNQIKVLRGLFRTVYFLPFVTSMVAVSIVWKIIFSEQTGLANKFLGIFGIGQQRWLAEARGIFDLMFSGIGINLPDWASGPSQALFAIIILTVWKSLGYNTIIYLAGLQNISKDYYEAAEIDGASKVKQFFRITMPLVSPTTFYVLMMTTIVTFQAFSQVYLMTGPPKGGPLGTTNLIVYYIFQKGFDAQEMGYASAAALMLFVVILGLTIIQKRLEKHVNY